MEAVREAKLIWQYLRPYKKTVIFIVTLTLISAAVTSFIPLLYGRLVDVAIGLEESLSLIFGLLGLWLGLRLLGDWFDRIADDKGYHLSFKVSHEMIVSLGKHLLELPMPWHKDRRLGEQLNKVTRGAGAIWNLIHETALSILPNILTVLVVVILMFITSWHLTLVLLVILGIYAQATLRIVKKLIPKLRAQHRQDEIAYGQLWDATTNVQVVKSNVNEDYERKRYKKVFGKSFRAASRVMPHWRSLSAWQQTAMGLGFVVVFGLAALDLRAGTMTAGQLVSFVGFVNLVIGPIGQVSNYYRTLKRQMTLIRRATALRQVRTENYNAAKGQVLSSQPKRGQIVFSSVYFKYDHNYVLRNINLTIKPGQSVALVGESGVGKSTFVDLISRYIEPSRGKILLDGVDTRKYSLRSLRSLLAIVPQEVTLFNDTVENNIRYGKTRAQLAEVEAAASTANASDFINELPRGYKTRVGERGIKLSVGQKQRIAIARAILRDPGILILDEATSALDSETERLVQEALQKLIRGRTTFIIAHRLSTIRHADLILVFDQGRIVERGPHSDLMKIKDGKYRRLHGLQHTYFT